MKLLAISFSLAVAMAQQPEAGVSQRMEVFTHAAAGPTHNVMFQAGPGTAGVRQFAMEYIGGEFGVAGKVVKGAPYSAEAVTETTQALADGNRIRHTSSTQIYRDSQGRTRRESVLGMVGLAPDVELPKLVFISDPVAGYSYTLNVKEKTATKIKVNATDPHMMALHSKLSAMPAMPAMPAGPVHMEARSTGGSASRTEVRTFAYSAGSMSSTAIGTSKDVKTEQLGRENREGVIAEGSRTTFTIPAGKIGNERPLDIVDERWYSPELETVISTRHVDPRNGETTYRLTNISRSEPSSTLFEVPADFKINEAQGDVLRMRMAAPPPVK